MTLDSTPPPLMNDAGALNLSAAAESPGLITDADGRIAFARVGGRMGVIAAEGRTSFIDGVNCMYPVALAPAGQGRMVVACREGQVLMFGEPFTAPRGT